MRSLLLTSILIATVLIPVLASRDKSAKRGLVRAMVGVALFNVFYTLACAYVWGRLP